jgi:hypothetical protein
MARYFMSSNPMEALGYATMGLTLFRRGKIRVELPKLVGKGRLDDLFDKVAQLEKQP